jgi:vacuolar protein sorting-associated protein VTA1
VCPISTQGLALEQRSPQVDGVLGALLAKLEKDKPGINAGPSDQQYCENFAVTVFNRADRADRAGRADKNTATTYYAASIFMEACFSPPCPAGNAHSFPVHALHQCMQH